MDNNQLEHRVKILSFISIVLFFVLMVVLFTLMFIFSGGAKTNDGSYSLLNQNQDYLLEPKEVELSEASKINEEALKSCEKIEEAEKTKCLDAYFSDKAKIDLNLGICELISDGISKTSCFDGIYVAIAGRDRNIDACEKLSQIDQRQVCANDVYYYLALDNPEEGNKYCEKIKNEKFKGVCLNALKK